MAGNGAIEPLRTGSLSACYCPKCGRSALGQCSVKMNLLGQAAQRVQATVFKT